MKKLFLAMVAAAMLMSNSAHATLIVGWSFDAPSGGTLTPNGPNSGTASLHGGTTGTFATGVSGQGWNTATYATQSTGSGTRGVQFLVNTTGFQDIQLAFAHRASGTASRWAQVDYTLDGTNWIPGFWNNGGQLTPHDNFYSFTVDFTSVTGANNNPNFGVRIVSIFSPVGFDQNSTLDPFAANTAYMRANAGAVYSPNNSTVGGDYSTSGTWRFDNVNFTGSAVPEPTALLMVGMAVVGCVARRRRRG